MTPGQVHADNQFGWAPMLEVAKLFAGIFLTIIPVIAMLKAGVNGPFGAVVSAVTRPDGSPDVLMYFWITGALSSFLDNAPTYLVFFNLAGGDAQTLMGPMALTLTAISAGAVFMGANSYIGNAPNFMVKAIAEDRGIKMPSFFGYMAWSLCILIPLFVIMTFIWFRP
jgi:Na+/H+ antiporter NhaD/arsenite permease-like protein